MRVLVIGIDGATLRLLEPLMAQGYMPFLSQVRQRGAMGPLATTFPPVTAPAWASFMTGKNPGKHGIFEFLLRRPGSFEQVPVNAGMLGSGALWEIIGREGKRLVLVSVPLTYPPIPVNGTLTSDFLAPKGAKNLSHPPELLHEIESKVGPYLLYHTQVYTKDNVAPVLKELEEHLVNRQQVAEYLMQRDPWDFCMVYFDGTDRLQHELWHVLDPNHPMHHDKESLLYAERTRSYFRSLDSNLARLAELAGKDTTIILMSDHGFGPIHKFVNFNVWLWQQGFLKFKHNVQTNVKRALFLMGLTPALGYKLSMNFGFANLRLSQGMTNRHAILETLRRAFLSFRSVDWTRTRAFSLGNYGQIYVNLKGREPYGSVEPADYESTRAEIASRLMEMQDPTNHTPVVERIFKTQDLFEGPFANKAPDLLFLLKDTYKALGTLEFASNRVIEPVFGNSGDHRMDGFVGMIGENVRSGIEITNASILDIAPTVLHLMGLPIPTDMDGHVLTDALTAEFLDANSISSMTPVGTRDQIQPDYTNAEAEEVKERLRALGYIG